MPQNTKEKASPMIHTPYTSHNEGLLGATMCHGPLCDLDQHCKHSFLRGGRPSGAWLGQQGCGGGRGGADKLKTSEAIPV